MSELFKRLRNYVVFTSVMFLVLGIILLVFPNIALETLFLIIGWMLVILGAASLIHTFFLAGKPIGQGALVAGFVELTIGLILVSRPGFVLALGAIVLGILLIINGAENIQTAREARALGYSWGAAVASGVVSLIMGAIVICNPFSTAQALLRVAGIFLIIEGVSNLVLTDRTRKW